MEYETEEPRLKSGDPHSSSQIATDTENPAGVPRQDDHAEKVREQKAELIPEEDG